MNNAVNYSINQVNALTKDEPIRFTFPVCTPDNLEASQIPTFAPGEEARVRSLERELSTMPPGSPQLEVDVQSWGRDTTGASETAAAMIIAILSGGIHTYRSESDGSNNTGEVTLSVNDHPMTIQYDNQFCYAAHEFGHMLGNSDEYDDKQVSGLSQTQRNLIAASGADAVVEDASTSSIMSAGGVVLPAHLSTAWEALTKMTRAHLSAEEWTF